jgi:hypothetical protein
MHVGACRFKLVGVCLAVAILIQAPALLLLLAMPVFRVSCRLAGVLVQVRLFSPEAAAQWGPSVARARGILLRRGRAAAVEWLRERAASLSRFDGVVASRERVARARRLAVSSRWGAALPSCRDPELIRWVSALCPLPPRQVWVAKLTLHRGAAPCVHGHLLDLALCLSLVRRGAAVGDVVLLISASRPVRPPVYVAAVAALGSRVVWVALAVFRVTAVLPLAAYYGGVAYRARPSAVYYVLPAARPGRPARPGGMPGPDGARWHTSLDLGAGAAVAMRRDLTGQVLLSSAWRAWGADLADAPFLPPALCAWVAARGSLRGGRSARAAAPGDGCVFDFVLSLAVP